MSALGPECGDRLRGNSVPGVNGHTGICVVPFEVDVAASDLDLPLVPGAGVVSLIDDTDVVGVLAVQSQKGLASADISVGVSENFKVTFSQAVLAQSAVENLEIRLLEVGDAPCAKIVDSTEVNKSALARLSCSEFLLLPFGWGRFVEFCGYHRAGGNGEKCQQCKSFHGMSLGCQFMAMVSALVATVNPSKMNTAGGGVPSVTSADRGQACLQQVAPNPSLSNLGRVGAICAARPAFWEAFHG